MNEINIPDDKNIEENANSSIGDIPEKAANIDIGPFLFESDDSDIITSVADTDETDSSTDEQPKEDRDDEEKSKAKMEVFDWMQCVVSAVICGIFVFVFIGRTIGVEGNSMLGTLHWYDRVIMTGIFYTPKNGDIVIFSPPTNEFGSAPLVKRIIAVEGQTVDIDFEAGNVFVDGVLEDYVDEPTHSRQNFIGPVTVPEGHVFVLGDNRNHSSDSRDSRVGMVDTRYILGRVFFLLIPGADNDGVRDWKRIGFVS